MNKPLYPSSTTTASSKDGGGDNEENVPLSEQQQQWCIHVKSVAQTTTTTTTASSTAEKDVSVCISPHRTVRDLKSSIETYTGVPEARQRLIYRGRILQDDSIPLHAIEGLSDSHTIHLVPRPVVVPPTTRSTPSSTTNSSSVEDTIRASGMTSVLRRNSSVRLQSSSSSSSPSSPSSSTRPSYRYSEEDFRIENPGSLEPIQQTLWTLNTTTTNSHGHAGPNQYRQFQVGQWIDCRDTVNQWLEATVMQIVHPRDILSYNSATELQMQPQPYSSMIPTTDPAVPVTDLEGRRKLLLEPCSQQDSTEQIDGEYYRPRSTDRMHHSNLQILHVHYNGWPVRWDEWIRSDSERIRMFRTRTRHPTSTTNTTACPRIDTPVEIPNHPPTPMQPTELLPNLSQAIRQLQQQMDHVVSMHPNSSSSNISTPRPEYWELAARLDRLGRALTEAAPHVASWNHHPSTPTRAQHLHDSIEEDPEHHPSEREDDDHPNTTDEEPPTTLGGLLSLLSGGNPRRRQQQRRRRRQDGDVDDQSHDDTTYHQPPSISSSYIALSSQQSVPTAEDDDEEEEEDEEEEVDNDDAEEEEREETSTVAATVDTIRNENHLDTRHQYHDNPDYTDFGFSMVNTTRGSTGLRRSGARWISSNNDDSNANNNNNSNGSTLAGLLGAYIAAASLMDDDGLGRLLRATNGGGVGGTNGGGIDIHIHAVVTTPDGGIMATTLPTANAIVEPSLDDEDDEEEEEEQTEERVPTPPVLRRPPPLSPHPNRLFATMSPVDGRRSRHHFSSHPRLRPNENNRNDEVIDNDDDEGIFDALYSENPEPINPRHPPQEEVEEQEVGVPEGHRQQHQQSQQGSSSSSTSSSSSSRGSHARRSNQGGRLSRFFRRQSPGDSHS